MKYDNVHYDNGVYSMNGMQAEVILASQPTNGAPPIITLRTRHPRPLHSEWMTHRDFGRNARSSRAVPIATMLAEIQNDPYIPWHWGHNQSGMQAGESFTPEEIEEFREDWLLSRDFAMAQAERYRIRGVHKQNPNRLLEPFMWIDVLTSSTKWANFFHLRDSKFAEPHFEDLAKMIKVAFNDIEYQVLQPGEWHLPYVTGSDWENGRSMIGGARHGNPDVTAMMLKLSTARCARISYKPFDGNASYEAEIKRHDDLVASDPCHSSPTEHQATPDNLLEGRKVFGDDGGWIGEQDEWDIPGMGGNLGNGWIQYRKTLAGEYIAD